MDYGFAHNATVFTPNGTTGVPVGSNDARNAAISADALKGWADCPERFTGYYSFGEGISGRDLEYAHGPSYFGKDCKVTLWTGETIGRITWALVYRHNFGGRFVAIRMTGTNGAEYVGRASFDNGNVINLRRVKS